jgi:nitrate reductase gamma subunit
MSHGRMVLLALAIEASTVLVLVLVVAVFGPVDPDAARAYAEQSGYWIGPVAGFALCLGGGWLVARRLSDRHVLRGATLGAMVAVIDLAILVAGGAGFRMIFVVSNLGRIVAGASGGLLARRGSSWE